MEFSYLLIAIIFLPGLLFAALGLSWLLGATPHERLVAQLTKACYALCTLGMAWLGVRMIVTGQTVVRASLGDWFTVEQYHFPLAFVLDRVAFPLVALTVILVGTVAAFSQSYLHRDEGYLRFFLLLNLFGFGALLLFTAATVDLIIGGWELVGLTSVLLIGFFQFREEPVYNALRVFLAYRVCDIGLLTGAALLHLYHVPSAFAEWHTHEFSPAVATIIGLLLLLAAMGKAAQVPFSGWLPRAMEGPTPSSAIFYGALSIHAGAYLLLRAEPLLAASRVATAAVIAIGLLTALHGTLTGRVSADAKTALAYAALTQVGLIFVEIGFGFTRLALFHICSHAVARTLQFLRAPSMLHDHHRLHAAAGGHLGTTGAYYEQLLPAGFRAWLYRLALERGQHDTALERFIVAPVLWLAHRFHQLESYLSNYDTPRASKRRLAKRAGVLASNRDTGALQMEAADV